MCNCKGGTRECRTRFTKLKGFNFYKTLPDGTKNELFEIIMAAPKKVYLAIKEQLKVVNRVIEGTDDEERVAHHFN